VTLLLQLLALFTVAGRATLISDEMQRMQN